MNKNITFKLFILFLAIFSLVTIHYAVSDYVGRVFNMIAITLIAAVSYNLVNGVTGQFSLEPNGFIAIGAYAGALLLLDDESLSYQFEIEDPASFLMHLNAVPIVAVLVGGILGTLLAFCLSFAVFRVRGDYLAIVTLGFGFIIRILAINNPQITNGSLGISEIPEFANIFWTGGVAIVAVVAVLNIVNSKYGRAMRAIRDDEDAALAMGIDTFKGKTLAFCTSAFFEGCAGALFASVLTTISPETFSFFLTFQLLVVIVLGGLGSTTGAVLGTFLVVGGGEFLRLADEIEVFGQTLPGLRMVIFSILLIVIMLFAREGMMGKRELTDLMEKGHR